MLATNSPLLFDGALEDMMISNGEDMSIFGESTETIDSLLHDSLTPFQQGVQHEDDFASFSPQNGENQTVKKLNHNAGERHRRKRINELYSSLRSLLPHADQMKKLSIPGTVARVLKYIPELQKELGLLQQKKESLVEKKAKREDSRQFERQRKDSYALRSSSVVSATLLSDKELMIQISTANANKGSFAQVLSYLEQNGFVLQDSSCFESFEGRVFYNLHLQVEETQVNIDLEELKEKLSNSLYEKQEEPFLLSFDSNDDLIEAFL